MADTHALPKPRIKKHLIDKIANLSSTEHMEIFKMLREAGVPFTQNSNGVFINFRSVTEGVISEIDKFVTFCFENKKDLDEYDKRLNECKLNNNMSVFKVGNTISGDEILNSCALDEFLASSSESGPDVNWVQAIKEDKERERLEAMIEVLENNIQRVHRKKTCNIRFANAKKKYARKVVPSETKKLESDYVDNLTTEPYKN